MARILGAGNKGSQFSGLLQLECILHPETYLPLFFSIIVQVKLIQKNIIYRKSRERKGTNIENKQIKNRQRAERENASD